MNDPKLREQLVRDEGRRLIAYKDTKGFYTIGVGHLLGCLSRMSMITDDECDALLNLDIETARASVARVFPEAHLDEPLLCKLDGARLRALINMMFNRGETHMRQSTTITPAIRFALSGIITPPGAWCKVAEAIKASPWAAQVGERASRLADMFERGLD